MAVVNTIAGIDARSGVEVWRARHTAPGRGLLRTVAAIAARAAALYFRYGGAATSIFRGAQLARTASTLRFSGLSLRAALPSLQTLATDSAREYVSTRFTAFGAAARVQSAAGGVRRAREVGRLAGRAPDIPRPNVDVEERLLDRLDPARQLERLAGYLLRRRRLAALRGEWMYFYTDLRDGRGLAGVNVNTGRSERALRLADPDERFISDESLGLLYTSKNNRLLAYPLGESR